ncbi:hypothetical protein F01_400151 [Burkholderia cenocepacia]|nr:hypothetical protein F01_400151 [Burkholderia cenocepacia]
MPGSGASRVTPVSKSATRRHRGDAPDRCGLRHGFQSRVAPAVLLTFRARGRVRGDADRARRRRDLLHAAAPESRSSARLLEDLVFRPDSVAPPHGDAGKHPR